MYVLIIAGHGKDPRRAECSSDRSVKKAERFAIAKTENSEREMGHLTPQNLYKEVQVSARFYYPL